MKVITPSALPRVTAIEFTDRELLLLEVALDFVTDHSNSYNEELYALYGQFGNVISDLDLNTLQDAVVE